MPTFAQNDFYKIGKDTVGRIASMIARSELAVIDGGILDEFEQRAASLFGHRFGVATCNGTAAIHLALFAIGIKHGDEVILPTYGFYAMVTPILQLGATPVFCDIHSDSLTIDVEQAASLVTPRTKAIMLLHSWGNPANLSKLRALSRERKIYLISDASHAHGATWSGEPIGAFCDVLCASFGVGKLISGGELGVATTDDAHLRDRMLLFGHLNRVPEAYLTDRYVNIENSIGIKYRPHAFALRLALDQMDSFPMRMQSLISNINELIGEIRNAGLTTQWSFPQSGRVFWKVIVVSDPPALRHLRKAAVAANLPIDSNHYQPLLHQTLLITKYYAIKIGSFPVSEKLAERIVQIDALQLCDSNIVSKYVALVRSLSRV